MSIYNYNRASHIACKAILGTRSCYIEKHQQFSSYHRNKATSGMDRYFEIKLTVRDAVSSFLPLTLNFN